MGYLPRKKESLLSRIKRIALICAKAVRRYAPRKLSDTDK
jgi:hypothetical protein